MCECHKAFPTYPTFRTEYHVEGCSEQTATAAPPRRLDAAAAWKRQAKFWRMVAKSRPRDAALYAERWKRGAYYFRRELKAYRIAILLSRAKLKKAEAELAALRHPR